MGRGATREEKRIRQPLSQSGTHMLAGSRHGLPKEAEADLAGELGEQLFIEARLWLVVGAVVGLVR